MDIKTRGKFLAVHEALKFLPKVGIISIGSGSTMRIFLELLAQKIEREKLKIKVIPSSYQIVLEARKMKIPMTSLYETNEPFIAFDGADEVDLQLNMIKGGGAALLREKVLLYSAKQRVIVVDESKIVKSLGFSSPVPIEVVPYAIPLVLKVLKKLGAKAEVRLAERKAGPVITDNGNFIVDVYFEKIENPKETSSLLKSIPGVIETGIFVELADILCIGYGSRDEAVTVGKNFKPVKF